MFTFIAWLILFVLCWPLAILALVLYPVFWLLSLPFRLLGIAVDGVFGLLKGIITLPVTLGKVPYCAVHMIDFLILNHPGAYNIILGRQFLATTKAAISMHYLA